MAPIHPFRRALTGVVGTALIALPLVALGATPAQAETPGVAASCAGLTVKPNGYAAKGELRIVVDGEVQTDGDETGWTTFKGSFPGVYAFEPAAVHRYTVEINSFGDGSNGRAFEPGTGGDVRVTGSTTPCSPVVVTGAGSNCTSSSGAGKQSVSLEFTGLRRSITYVSEVLDANGEVVKHFQFRTAPVVEHRFTGLTAGATYLARVTDQSNPVLSGAAVVRIGDCATTPTMSVRFSPCSVDDAAASLAADLTGLVPGRDYRVGIVVGSGSPRERELHPTGSTATVAFGGLVRGSRAVVTAADSDAPRSVRLPVAVPGCDTTGGSRPAAGDPSPGTTAPPTGGSAGAGQPGVPVPSAGAGGTGVPVPSAGVGQPSAPGRPSRPIGTNPHPSGSTTPGTASQNATGGSSAAAGAPGSSVSRGDGPASATEAIAEAGPGDLETGTVSGGSSAGGPVAAIGDRQVARVPAPLIALGISLVVALGLGTAGLVRHRRAGRPATRATGVSGR
jgi:hypothetical protein